MGISQIANRDKVTNEPTRSEAEVDDGLCIYKLEVAVKICRLGKYRLCVKCDGHEAGGLWMHIRRGPGARHG